MKMDSGHRTFLPDTAIVQLMATDDLNLDRQLTDKDSSCEEAAI